jgi:AraC-like DNA-binding protein
MTAYLQKDLFALKSKHVYIDDIFVYIKDEDYLVTAYGSYESSFFFDRMQPGKVKEALSTPVFFEPMTVQGYKTPSSPALNAVLINTTLPGKQQEFNIFVSVVINEAKITKEITSNDLTQNGYVFITDENNRLITRYFTGQGPAGMDDQLESLVSDNGQGVIKLSGKSFIKTTVISDFNGWKYTALIPYNEVANKTEGIKIFTFSLFFLLAFVSLIVSLLSANKLYKPIRSLVNTFSKQGPVKDEFLFISDNIKNILLENQDWQEKFLETLPALQTNFLKSVLNCEIKPDELNDKVIQYNIRFPYRFFTVLLFEFKESGSLDQIQSVFSGYYQNCYILEESSYYIAILNYNDNLIDKIVQDLSVLPLLVTQGKEYAQLQELHKSYGQAKNCRKYKTLNKSFEYINCLSLLGTNKNAYPFPSEFEKHFSNALNANSFPLAAEHVRNAASACFNPNVPLIHIEQNLDMFIKIFLERCAYFHADAREITSISFDGEALGTAFASCEDYVGFVQDIYSKLCDYVKNLRSNNDTSLFNKMRRFIEENLSKDISLEMLADRFGISYNHLSKVFKDHLGMNYVEYVTKLRIDLAKKLLLETNLKIEEISCQVGYSSSVTFIRNFNKYEGISPGQYRKKL